jgi:hypothetical protein
MKLLAVIPDDGDLVREKNLYLCPADTFEELANKATPSSANFGLFVALDADGVADGRILRVAKSLLSQGLACAQSAAPLTFYTSIAAVANREQLFAIGMLCTDSRHGRFFWGLDWYASRCSRKFCAAIADVRKRKFHRWPYDPPAECRRVGTLGNRVFALDIVFRAAAKWGKAAR